MDFPNFPEIVDHTEDVDNGEFYFESDHLALRGNSDYSAVLKTIVILEAQRIKAAKDIEKLAAAQKDALKNPEEFISRLVSSENLNLPGQIKIAELPKVNFDKYNVKFPEIVEAPTRASIDAAKVRGKTSEDNKSSGTFNQLWTAEEQRRLEELLIEYPPEPVEMQRFAKIARALGNRTTKQVASRLQKFFRKLHVAGLPIPGRIPKGTRYSTVKHSRWPKRAPFTSTYFPAHNVPVLMPEDDDLNDAPSSSLASSERVVIPGEVQQLKSKSSSAANSVKSFGLSSAVIVDEDSGSEELASSEQNFKIEARKLKLLTRVRADREKTYDLPISEHYGYECDLCLEEPIIGTRWHCVNCTEESIDYCTDCFINQLLSEEPHPLMHKFNALRINFSRNSNCDNIIGDFNTEELNSYSGEDSNEESSKKSNIHDRDYHPAKFSKDEEYNYLDPNFLPD